MAYFLCKNRAQALQSFLAEYWLLTVAEILHRTHNTTILPFITRLPPSSTLLNGFVGSGMKIDFDFQKFDVAPTQ
jgi:hypothetical protein